LTRLLIAFLAEVKVVKFFSEPEVLFQALAASLMNVEVPIFVVPGSTTSPFVIALVVLD
jgi:hypothetical protein